MQMQVHMQMQVQMWMELMMMDNPQARIACADLQMDELQHDCAQSLAQQDLTQKMPQAW